MYRERIILCVFLFCSSLNAYCLSGPVSPIERTVNISDSS